MISQALKPEKAERVIDATGMVVVPGFVNTHHHFYQTLTRNIPAVQDAPLFEWLVKSYEIWRQLTLEGVELSTRTAILEMMKSGVTASSDHLYLFPEKTGKALIDAEIQVAKQMGFRFHATRGSMSLGRSVGGLPPDDVVQTETQIEEDMERLFREYHDDSEGAMTRLALAPCSPFSVTPELMRRTLKFAKDHGLLIHTHLAETLDEEKFCIKRFGMRPVEYMESLGWLDPISWFAHCVHLLPEEIKNMGETRCGVSHCPSSNMRLGSGIAPIREMLNEGVRVSLGVDGSASNDSSNMLLEMQCNAAFPASRSGAMAYCTGGTPTCNPEWGGGFRTGRYRPNCSRETSGSCPLPYRRCGLRRSPGRPPGGPGLLYPDAARGLPDHQGENPDRPGNTGVR